MFFGQPGGPPGAEAVGKVQHVVPAPLPQQAHGLPGAVARTAVEQDGHVLARQGFQLLPEIRGEEIQVAGAGQMPVPELFRGADVQHHQTGGRPGQHLTGLVRADVAGQDARGRQQEAAQQDKKGKETGHDTSGRRRRQKGREGARPPAPKRRYLPATAA